MAAVISITAPSARPRSGTRGVGSGLGINQPLPVIPGQAQHLAESMDRTHRSAMLAAVAHSPRRHPIGEAPMVGGVSPRGEPPWGIIGAREQGGFGIGLYDLVSPNPALEDAQMRQRHAARV